MKNLYNPENDEIFGAGMLQNTLAEAKKQSSLDEALAVIESAAVAFRENTEALNRIDRTMKTFAADSTPFMETTQKLIALLEEIMEGKLPTRVVKIVNNNIISLAKALGKVVNDRIEESDKVFYQKLDERVTAIKKQLDFTDRFWTLIYIGITNLCLLFAFLVVILVVNWTVWHNVFIYKLVVATIISDIVIIICIILLRRKLRESD